MASDRVSHITDVFERGIVSEFDLSPQCLGEMYHSVLLYEEGLEDTVDT